MAAKEPARAISRAMVMGAHVVRVMSGWHRSTAPTTASFLPVHRSHHWSFQRADKALLDWNDGRQHNARAAAEKRALFYCLSNGLSDLALGE